MSKRRKHARKDRTSDIVVTLASGHEVECYPIGPMIETIQAQHDERADALEIPIQVLEGVGGSAVERAYDDKSILGSSVPDEDKTAYALYKIAFNAIQTEKNQAVIKAIALKGTKVLTMPPEDEWVEEHEFVGMTVPDGKLRRLWHYWSTEVLASPQDGIELTAGIFRASGVDEETVAKAMASFQDKMGRAEGADAEDDQQVPETVGEEEEQEGLDG